MACWIIRLSRKYDAMIVHAQNIKEEEKYSVLAKKKTSFTVKLQPVPIPQILVLWV